MSISVVMFDLDGTLLPMDRERFVRQYFGTLAKKLAPHGYDPERFIEMIKAGVGAMVCNDGARLNRDVFFDVFCRYFGERAELDMHLFDEFYKNDFDREVRSSCGYDPTARAVIDEIKHMGLRVVLATNPLFPASATESRIRWAGLSPSDFELYTTYDNSRHCKPQLEYYTDILQSLGVNARDCIMVGNDVGEDMIARRLGMEVFLLPAELINESGEDISVYPHGELSELPEYIKKLNCKEV